jgi:hypothetical protein
MATSCCARKRGSSTPFRGVDFALKIIEVASLLTPISLPQISQVIRVPTSPKEIKDALEALSAIRLPSEDVRRAESHNTDASVRVRRTVNISKQQREAVRTLLEEKDELPPKLTGFVQVTNPVSKKCGWICKSCAVRYRTEGESEENWIININLV